ncbi:hypothetical protein [Sphingomonas sp. YR710]|uniref:hypothetical protein n=1 Tax=Sphingomonas sp. YR710 TaxID=1882773 RepID=UPI00115FCC94|nr:hypothetical protein [Sphingomonas sp. YR710]
MLALAEVIGYAEVRGRRVFGWCFYPARHEDVARIEISVDGKTHVAVLANRRWTGALPPGAPHIFCGFEALLDVEKSQIQQVKVAISDGPTLLEREVNLAFFHRAHLEAKLYANNRVEGWAWSPQAGDRIEIDVITDDRRPITIRTDRYRDDLRNIGMKHALCGYSINLRRLGIGLDVSRIRLRAVGLEREVEIIPPAEVASENPNGYRGHSALMLQAAPRFLITL